MTTGDIITWLNAAQTELAPSTVREYVENNRKFFHSLGRPQAFEGVSFSGTGRKYEIDVLEPEEILRMMRVTDNQRDRTIVITLYDTGGRQGGFLPLQVKDIEFVPESVRIHLWKSKKNPKRYVEVYKCPADLKIWFSMHPGPRDSNGNLDPETPLWVDLDNPTEPIGEDALWSLLRRLARRAGITKRVHPHGFRHTRATHLAKVMTDAQMRVFFGWGPRSQQPSNYAQLAGRDTMDPLRRDAGLETAKPKPDLLRIRNCGNCGHANSPAALVCMVCSRGLNEAGAFAAAGLRTDGDATVAEVLRRLIQRVPQVVAEVINDPPIRERLTALERQAALTHTPD